MNLNIFYCTFQLIFVSFSRAAQGLDLSGVTAAAHAIALQVWSMSSIVVYAMCGVSSILIPSRAAANGGNMRYNICHHPQL